MRLELYGGIKIRESDLYLPVKEYLEINGYKVNSEVMDCDVTGLKDNEIVIVELKKKINITLLIQAVERLKITDAVYIAVPMPKRVGRNSKKLERLINGA